MSDLLEESNETDENSSASFGSDEHTNTAAMDGQQATAQGTTPPGAAAASATPPAGEDTIDIRSLEHLWDGATVPGADDATAGSTMLDVAAMGAGDTNAHLGGGRDDTADMTASNETARLANLHGATRNLILGSVQKQDRRNRRKSIATPDMLKGLLGDSMDDDSTASHLDFEEDAANELTRSPDFPEAVGSPSPLELSGMLHRPASGEDDDTGHMLADDDTGSLLLGAGPPTTGASSSAAMSPPKSIQLVSTSRKERKLKSSFKSGTRRQSHSSPRVNFGSPGVAEFNRNTPPISMRKLSRGDSKKLFPLDGGNNAEEEDDPETRLNSSVLEEAGEYSDSSSSSSDEDEAAGAARRRSSVGVRSRRSSIGPSSRRGSMVLREDMSFSSVGAESMDEEISFNHGAEKPDGEDGGDGVVSFNASASQVSMSMDASVDSTDTEDDSIEGADRRMTMVLNTDMSQDDSGAIAASPSAEEVQAKPQTPPSRHLKRAFDDAGADDHTVPLGNLAALVRKLDDSDDSEADAAGEDKTVALESLSELLKKKQPGGGQEEGQAEEEEKSGNGEDVEDHTVELEGGLRALISEQLDSEDDDYTMNPDLPVLRPGALGGDRRGSIVLNESMDLTEDVGEILRSSGRNVTLPEVARALGVQRFVRETPASALPLPANTPAGDYGARHGLDAASRAMHLLLTVPDAAIHEWACGEMRNVVGEATAEYRAKVGRLEADQPAIFRHVGNLSDEAGAQADDDTRAKAQQCTEINRLAAAKEWCLWQVQIEKRLQKDYVDLNGKMASDKRVLEEEMERAENVEISLKAEFSAFQRLVALQEEVKQQQQTVDVFQGRFDKARRSLANAQESARFLKAQREQLQNRIAKREDLVVRYEALKVEVATMQDIYALASKFCGWKCTKMTPDSIQFERPHGNGMSHLLSTVVKLVNGESSISCDSWLVDRRKFEDKSVLPKLLAAQDVACDSVVRRIGTKAELSDAMLVMDVMFGRCKLLANEFEHVCENFSCEDIVFGSGNHVAFNLCLTATSPVATKWTVRLAVGFGYPAGAMEVSVKHEFGVAPVYEFNVRSIGKGFNRLLRVCKAVQLFFYKTVDGEADV
jgi:hypothetical protein